MNKNMSTSALTEGAILAAITALLGVISYYIPFFSLLIFVWPIPIIILGKKHGMRVSIIATVAAGVLLSLFTPIIYAIPIVIMYGILGIVLGFTYYKEMGMIKSITMGYAAALVSIILLLQLYNMITGISIVAELSQTMKLAVKEVSVLYQNMGVDSSTVGDMAKKMEDVITSITLLFPAILLMIPMIVTLLNMLISQKILKKLGYDVMTLIAFRKWRVPFHASSGLFLILMLAMLGQFFGLPNFDVVFQNLLYLVFMVFLVQGLSFMAHIFYAKSVNKGIRIVSFIAIFIIPIIQSLVQIIGLLDIMFNIRDKIKLEQS